IVVLKDGLIMQVGTPRTLYEKPDNLFVAQFIGSPKMNVIPCSASGDRFLLEGHDGGPYTPEDKATPPVSLGIRPEHITVVPEGEGHCSGHVEIAEYLGADTLLYVHCDGLGVITVRGAGEDVEYRGKDVGLKFDESRLHFFAADERAIV
ncbi:MAG: ABC transporter ATP-binding protein, partial [Rhodobiaceae bacterium]|nr:ABC transporter ATP-binding protein [Rhodobiaceae bacterium]